MKNRTNTLLILVVLLLFSSWGVARHLHMYGEDLASSYVGCRLLAAGEGSHLYSHDSRIFSVVGDGAWYAMAQRSGYTALQYLHPYVQTPLWAWSLQPICTRMNFRPFCDGFIAVFMICTSALLFLVARYWTPALFHPGKIAVVFAVLYVSEPFKYSIFLAQTHILFLLLSVTALLLARRDRSILAGIILALAAMVKITPGFLCVYWLMTRQWKAAVSFVLAFAFLTALGVVALGPGITRAYLHSLSENGNVLLVAFNNQSFAGWWMGRRFPRSEITNWWIYPLPAVLKVISLALCVGGTTVGGWLDRRAGGLEHATEAPGRPPYGAAFALVAATAFTPIAWGHYYILLVIPGMMLFAAYMEDRRPLWLGFLVVIIALNLYPISYGSVHLIYKSFSLVRSQFYSGLVAMTALLSLALLRSRGEGRVLPSRSPWQVRGEA